MIDYSIKYRCDFMRLVPGRRYLYLHNKLCSIFAAHHARVGKTAGID